MIFIKKQTFGFKLFCYGKLLQNKDHVTVFCTFRRNIITAFTDKNAATLKFSVSNYRMNYFLIYLFNNSKFSMETYLVWVLSKTFNFSLRAKDLSLIRAFEDNFESRINFSLA